MAGLIEDYAIIGDCTTAAMVGRNGSIDWLCWPRFDSGACFAALLGNEENGRWIIEPLTQARITRRYREGTLILETDFETDEGAVRLIDFMPMEGDKTSVVRIVKGLRGKVSLRTELIIRFDYGVTIPWVSRNDERLATAVAGPDMLAIRADIELYGKDQRTMGDFEVAEGETVCFSLTYGRSFMPIAELASPQDLLDQTERFWVEWIAKSIDAAPYTRHLHRSLITLKGLTFQWTGGIVAAVTTSLPEKLGGERNWDYRFCWLRDSTLTLLAFMHAGYNEEATAWQTWLLRAVAGSPEQFQIMYGVAGERRLTETELPWLSGYENSAPVRIGNAAAGQLQLDVYGELIETLSQSALQGLPVPQRSYSLRRATLEHLAKIWREPDEGIWEIRGDPRHFTHSKVMAWLAFQRATLWHDPDEPAEDRARWGAIAQTIHDEVCEKAFDPELNSFVQSYGSKLLDASLLLLAMVGFLPYDDPRIIGTVAAIERRLMYKGLVLRYETETENVDGLPAGEGAFLACSFWLVDNYVLANRLEEARQMFDRLLQLTNDVGLISEEYDVENKRMLGNFPQAFTHVAIVNTALNLTSAVGPAASRQSPEAAQTD